MEISAGKVKIKNSKVNLFIILLIVVILIVSMLGAYAIYTTTQSKSMGVNIAQFSFNVDLKNINGGQNSVVNLAETVLSDTAGSVQSGKIAPGTYGAFDLIMDGSSSGVSLDYYININTRINIESEEGYLPRNLKFYRLKQGKTEGTINEESLEDTNEATARFEQVGVDGSIRITGDIAVNVINEDDKIKSERIYWIWPYETINSYTTVEKGDFIDTNDLNNNLIKDNNDNIIGIKEIKLPIKVVAEQKTLDSKKKLAYLVKVGDIVNYNVGGIATVSGTGENHTDNLEGTSVNGVLSTNEVTRWRVLSIEGDTVNLVAANTTETTVTLGVKDSLEGIEAYVNAEKALDNVCGIFKNENFAVEARSIKITDIEQYYKPDRIDGINNFLDRVRFKKNLGLHRYKKLINVNISLKSPENRSMLLNDVSSEKKYVKMLTGQSENPVPENTLEENWYFTVDEEETKKYLGYDESNIIYKLIVNKIDNEEKKECFWLGIPSVRFDYTVGQISKIGYIGMFMNIVDSGYINYKCLYYSTGETFDYAYSILPVVSLKSNIKGNFNEAVTLGTGENQIIVNEWDILN